MRRRGQRIRRRTHGRTNAHKKERLAPKGKKCGGADGGGHGSGGGGSDGGGSGGGGGSGCGDGGGGIDNVIHSL